ncbi:hypothetical protein Ddye_028611 [Dipteronia dyeriana]|uniref:Uncharacterized protein n=1 Tax=Dipteronia dyeriana TaxID=168575 RepID=A0AAD9TCW1_9ROSI|nr:hypothetical protein Ddye_028611 [Dipteronia dyeriana]
MNLFQLFKCLLQEIYSLCAQFWWGSNGQSRKIHWCTWSRLCEAKEKGGLGFRDLEIFNKTLLANQCWRLINNGNSLAASVLKACYFPNKHFVDAEVKSTASFIWKSLIWGKEIIVVGFRWRVGDGSKIRIYKDRWILRPSTFKPISPQSSLLTEDAIVNQLLTLSGSWEVNLLNSTFREEDVTVV